jgi:HNH endonuclease
LIEGCDRPHEARGFCNKHYLRFRKYGDPLHVEHFRGAGHIHPKGYRLLYRPSHPNASRQGYVLEHVAVMAEAVGRPLRKDERVHHKNGQRADNRLQNLELWSIAHPSGQRVVDLVAFAREVLERYGSHVIEGGQ